MCLGLFYFIVRFDMCALAYSWLGLWLLWTVAFNDVVRRVLLGSAMLPCCNVGEANETAENC